MEYNNFKQEFINYCEQLHPNQLKYVINAEEETQLQLLYNAVSKLELSEEDKLDFVSYVIYTRYEQNRYGIWNTKTYSALHFMKSFDYFFRQYMLIKFGVNIELPEKPKTRTKKELEAIIAAQALEIEELKKQVEQLTNQNKDNEETPSILGDLANSAQYTFGNN